MLSMKRKTEVLISSKVSQYIILWNGADALVSPNGVTWNSKVSQFVMKPVFLMEAVSILVCERPDAASKIGSM